MKSPLSVLISLLIIAALTSACGGNSGSSGGGSGEESSASSTVEIFGYQFSRTGAAADERYGWQAVPGCTTGSQTFGSLAEMCLALGDDELNNECAATERSNLFAERCQGQDYKSCIIIRAGEDSYITYPGSVVSCVWAHPDQYLIEGSEESGAYFISLPRYYQRSYHDLDSGRELSSTEVIGRPETSPTPAAPVIPSVPDTAANECALTESDEQHMAMNLRSVDMVNSVSLQAVHQKLDRAVRRFESSTRSITLGYENMSATNRHARNAARGVRGVTGRASGEDVTFCHALPRIVRLSDGHELVFTTRAARDNQYCVRWDWSNGGSSTDIVIAALTNDTVSVRVTGARRGDPSLTLRQYMLLRSDHHNCP